MSAKRTKQGVRIGLVALACVSALATAEAAIRLYDWMRGVTIHTHNWQTTLRIPHPYLNWTWKPNSVARVDLRHPKVYRYNAAGLRGRPFEPVKPAGVFRVICLGESSTWGDYALSGEEMTWPAQLERMLQEAYPGRRIEVINAGLPSWMTYENLFHLNTRLLGYEPDLLLVYEMVNDLGLIGVLSPEQDVGALRRHLIGHPVHRWLCHSATYSFISYWLTGRLGLRGSKDPWARLFEPQWVPFGARSFERNLSLMVRVAQAERVPIVLSTQALRVDRIHPYHRELVEPMQEIIRAVGRTYRVPVVEIAGEIPPELFTSEVHVYDAGAAIIATKFFDTIRAQRYL
ncbi:MAG: hypothetical protein HYY91_00625 [Candidatus Omnitrophica bacterium]|nr:hypothetical protein [Candidatus Omnitrophota bacterium]